MSFDPENIIFTTAGRNYLLERQAAGQKALLGSFRIGHSNLFVPNESNTGIFGMQTYIGLNDEIFWIKYSESEVVFRCCIEHNKGDFDIGNIGIFSDSGVLLFIAKFPYIHRKMRTKETSEAAGGRWTFQVRLMMDNMFELWDFSNITPKYAEMQELMLTDAPNYPFDSFYTELQLNNSFLPTNRSGYLCISGNTSRHWFTSPFQMSEANVIVYERYHLDGGEENDKHTGIW